MRPFNGGGEMIREVSQRPHHLCRSRRRASRPVPRRSSKAVGLAAALDYLTAFDRTAVAAHEHDLLDLCPRGKFGQFNWLKCDRRCPRQGRNPVIRSRGDACPRPGHHIWTGKAWRSAPGITAPKPLMERFQRRPRPAGPASHLYNTRADVDALIAGLSKAREAGTDMDRQCSSRTVSGSHPRPFAPSAPLRRAWTEASHKAEGSQSFVRRSGHGLSQAGCGRPRRRHQASKARAAPSARPALR